MNGKPQGGKPANQPTAAGGTPSRKAGRVSDAASKLPSAGVAKAVEKAKAAQAAAAEQSAKNQARGLLIFSHFGLPKPVSSAKGDIHPVIVRTALQFSSFKITGANARCIATLTAFKTVSRHYYVSPTGRILIRTQVIQDYVTPPNNTLSRHLMTHLSPQISHLVAARPMSVTMGNAIRQLKLDISGSDIDLPEQDVRFVRLDYLLAFHCSSMIAGQGCAISEN